jgi:catechol 2,3-dioxygenase-like lactoylglutathione lyase family enzyme
MLASTEAAATIAVKDLSVARKFYEGTLGLKLDQPENPEVAVYKSGGSKIIVYKSQYAGTNEATAATWTVGDTVAEVRDLKAKGVRFERYDMPGMVHEGDVHVMGEMKAAWFKDPDGNILSVVSG